MSEKARASKVAEVLGREVCGTMMAVGGNSQGEECESYLPRCFVGHPGDTWKNDVVSDLERPARNAKRQRRFSRGADMEK